MSMTKAEKARMAELEHALNLARALRFPDYPVPTPMTYDEIKAALVDGGVKYGSPQKVARGWFYNANLGGLGGYSNRVTYGCSDGIFHSREGDTTTSQNAGRMYRTREEAVMAMRHELTTQCAKRWRRSTGCWWSRHEPLLLQRRPHQHQHRPPRYGGCRCNPNRNRCEMSTIDVKYRAQMNALAGSLDRAFNGDNRGKDRTTGFVLLMFPFDTEEGARTNYISNADRRDIVVALKEIVARFEGQPEIKGRG